MRTQLKEIKKYSVLYGYTVTILQLKKIYTFVSYAEKSIPTPGSRTLTTDKLNEGGDTLLEKIILHKNNDITLKTNYGYLKFSN